MRASDAEERARAAVQCAYRLKPVIVTGPGAYQTRGGRIVRIHAVLDRGVLPCEGTHDCGTPDTWARSGRLLPWSLSDHDLVQRLS